VRGPAANDFEQARVRTPSVRKQLMEADVSVVARLRGSRFTGAKSGGGFDRYVPDFCCIPPNLSLNWTTSRPNSLQTRTPEERRAGKSRRGCATLS
jgi:hypothetical protein